MMLVRIGVGETCHRWEGSSSTPRVAVGVVPALCALRRAAIIPLLYLYCTKAMTAARIGLRWLQQQTQAASLPRVAAVAVRVRCVLRRVLILSLIYLSFTKARMAV